MGSNAPRAPKHLPSTSWQPWDGCEETCSIANAEASFYGVGLSAALTLCNYKLLSFETELGIRIKGLTAQFLRNLLCLINYMTRFGSGFYLRLLLILL